MATYKVPQDVEAEDKIVGFLSLKQFVFVIVMIASLWLCWILLQINFLLALIPLPIAIVSGVLGLYQRSDQPIEVFLASWLRFKLKPRKRRWDQEGLDERVIITAPKTIEKNYTKGLTEQQVSSRLMQLSSLLDSRGWASKQITSRNTFTGSQRLFSPEEMARYAAPRTPFDNEATSVFDQYDTEDPRNRIAQEVNRDFDYVTKQKRQEAQAVVEKARTESTVLEKSSAPITAPPVARPTEPTPSVAKEADSDTVTAPPQPLAGSQNKLADDEVIIDISHKK